MGRGNRIDFAGDLGVGGDGKKGDQCQRIQEEYRDR